MCVARQEGETAGCVRQVGDEQVAEGIQDQVIIEVRGEKLDVREWLASPEYPPQKPLQNISLASHLSPLKFK